MNSPKALLERDQVYLKGALSACVITFFGLKFVEFLSIYLIMTSHGMLAHSLAALEQPLKYHKTKRDNVRQQYVFHNLNGGSVRKLVDTYNGSSGGEMESWCETHLTFSTTMKDWGITTGPLKFEKYPLFLSDHARTIWDQEKSNANGMSNNEFNNCVQWLVTRIAGPNPCDKCSEYLILESAVNRPYKVDVYMHASRLETLFTYHDMLPGNTPKMMTNTEEAVLKRKRILFFSFPPEWQSEFNRRYPHGYADPQVSWNDIVEYMRGLRIYLSEKKQLDERRAERRRQRSGRTQQDNNRTGRRPNYRSMQNRPYPTAQNYRRYPSQGTNQFQRNLNNNNRFQARQGGGRFQTNQGAPTRNQGNRNQNGGRPNFSRNRNQNFQRQQQHSNEQHYLADTNPNQFQGQEHANEQSYSNEQVGDANDQDWSYPEMDTPDGSAECGTELYNSDFYNQNNHYHHPQMDYHMNDEHHYSQVGQPDLGPYEFDDSYYYDEDHAN